jgi:hypothetical protein
MSLRAPTSSGMEPVCAQSKLDMHQARYGLVAVSHEHTEAHTQRHTQTDTDHHSPTHTLFFLHRAESRNLYTGYTLVLTLVAHSKKVKHRNGPPTTCINDWLHKKSSHSSGYVNRALETNGMHLICDLRLSGLCTVVHLFGHSHMG